MIYLYFLILEVFCTNHKGLESVNGKFRVKYKDGRVSQRMYLATAESYQGIFGGEIIKHDKQRENTHAKN